MRRYLVLFSLLVIMVCSAGERGLPTREGIRNFGKVNDALYRGAQPDAPAIANLKRLGVKSIVSLRTPGKDWKMEAAAAQAHGLICTNFPLSGIHSPKGDQVQEVLATIKTLPAPVFVHCQHGCDRTGTIVACYRILYEKWSNQEALQEAERYGISSFERGMKQFIRDFGKTGTKSTRSKPRAKAVSLVQ